MTTCDVVDCADESTGTYQVEDAGSDRVAPTELCEKHYHWWRGNIVEEA